MAESNRTKFIELMTEFASKHNSPYLLTEKQYAETLATLKSALEKKTTKTNREYRLINRYSILNIGGVDKLIVRNKDAPNSIRYIVSIEQVCLV